ncbi:IS3-like element ISVpa4 family transposase [Vibrio cholerae]|nr:MULTISPECIES: IS3-like element ISVpa4 family transposase [Gammaproteobacteria]HBY0402553.1 IS3-like element ISVpa4 family transposase [Klebsiella pneumoniae subsp. pneumoniae]EKT4488447.1 IS3-like element ISVpa4 family transposase [Shewanella algae]MBE5155687.1 IS3-like element ISVpa4 family transposase [Vibrio parahaemolyticus]MBE5165004.1 IS3-like element ISVpa4 family transposase [Vibrio parahaemolyticus]MDF4176086.1 IS3-like element ISVpa4 family transposase [Providencia thailandensis]
MTRKRRNHSPEFKAKVALDAAKGDKTVAELAQKYNLHANQISTWKKELLENAAMIFATENHSGKESSEEVDKLHAKIGQLTMENGFFGQSARSLDRAQRKSSLVKSTPLPIKRQCELLNIARSTAYYQPIGLSAEEITLRRMIDEIHLQYPFMGSRRIRTELAKNGHSVNRKRVVRLMRDMGIGAIYPKPKTTLANKAHKVYPYLLRDIEVTYPNQAWAIDITYIPMAKGFLYLVAIIDWYSRKVLAWRLSNTMDTSFCIEALEEALKHYGPPDIFNSDQGSQFTSTEFTQKLIEHNVRISMDGKGRWVDNVFIERLWRSLKYEEVYLKAYTTPREAELEIGNYMVFYNEERNHQGLNNLTPDEAYFGRQRYAA